MNVSATRSDEPRIHPFWTLFGVAAVIMVALFQIPRHRSADFSHQFEPVIEAAAPIKAFISACALSSECSSGDVIDLSGDSQTSQNAHSPPPAEFSPTQEEMYYLALAFLATTGGYSAQGAPFLDAAAASAALDWTARDKQWAPGPDPNSPGRLCVLMTNGECARILTESGEWAAVSAPVGLVARFRPRGDADSDASRPLARAPCVGASRPECSPPTDRVFSASADSSGVITAVAQTSGGLEGETYVLTPTFSGGVLTWSVSGTCKARAGGSLC